VRPTSQADSGKRLVPLLAESYIAPSASSRLDVQQLATFSTILFRSGMFVLSDVVYA